MSREDRRAKREDSVRPRCLCTLSARVQVAAKACYSVRATHKDKVTQVAILRTGCGWTRVNGGMTNTHTHTHAHTSLIMCNI